MKSLIAATTLSLLSGIALAQATPSGLWKTIDDKTKQEKSLVRISESAGVFSAKIEKIVDPAKQESKCDKCADDRKDQPLIGLTIVRNVKKNADDAELWDGGEILDPNDGKVYKVRIKPIEGGKKLEVRGYVGMPMLGRTQTWIRVE